MRPTVSGVNHLGFGAEHEARLYRLLVKELTEYAIFFINPNGRLASWNSGVERILGYREDEFLDQPFSILFTPEDQRAGIPERELSSALEGDSASDERWHVRKSGERFFASGLVIAVHGASREFLGCTKVMRDYTQRKKAEERLAEAYSKYKEIARALDLTHMIIRDSEGKIRLWTEGAQELYGWTVHEAVGAVSWQLLDTEFPEPLEEIQATLQQKGQWQGELKRRSKDGRDVFAASHWVAHYTEAGEMLIIDVNNDITERKAAEMALRESEETIRALLESAAQGIVGVDSEGKMTVVNATAEKLFGYRREELLGQRIEMLLPEGVRHRHIEHRADYFSHPRPRPMGIGLDLKARRKDGTEFPVEISLSHVETRSGPLAVSLITDITQRKQAEEALATQAQELRRANEELSQFAHTAAHDLQAPLRNIKTSAQVIARRYQGQLDQTADQFINYIVNGIDQMQELIEALLTYAREGEGSATRDAVQVSTVIETVLANLRTQIEKAGAEVICEMLPVVEADVVQLVQLFQNLIGNAIKYRSQEPPRIVVKARELPGKWLFSVRDNGVGIPPEFRERIFAPLKRLHGPEISGTGIGLAICKKIVESSGGRIWVEPPATGQGSIFYFTLPAMNK